MVGEASHMLVRPGAETVGLVENAIASAKHYRRASSACEGTFENFNVEFNIAC